LENNFTAQNPRNGKTINCKEIPTTMAYLFENDDLTFLKSTIDERTKSNKHLKASIPMNSR